MTSRSTTEPEHPKLSEESTLLRRRVGDAFTWAVIGLAAFWAIWPTIGRGFIGDDFAYVARFAGLEAADLPALFVNDWSGGIWGSNTFELRPVAALTFWLDARLWGIEPTGFRITNLLLYVLACGAVASIARRIHTRSRWAGLAAALVFALYPAHAEPLGWITGRVDLIAGACVLWSFAFALRALDDRSSRIAIAGSVLCFAVGMFAKEISLILPLLVCGWVLLVRRESQPWSRGALAGLAAGYISSFGVYLACRAIAFESTTGGRGFAVLSTEFFVRQIDYAGWLFPPALTWIRSSRESLAESAGMLVPAATVLVLAASVFAWRMTRRGGLRGDLVRLILFFVVLWCFVTIYPLASVSYFSPRHIYLATAGLSVAFACALSMAIPHTILRTSLAAVCLVWMGWSLRRESRPWCNAARVSENISKAIAAGSGDADAGATLIVDAPRTFQGAWAWAWAAPFSLRSPYCTVPYERILESPDCYFRPELWTGDRQPRATAQGRSAVLIRVASDGSVISEQIPAAVVSAALRHFESSESDVGATERAWRRFVASLSRDATASP